MSIYSPRALTTSLVDRHTLVTDLIRKPASRPRLAVQLQGHTDDFDAGADRTLFWLSSMIRHDLYKGEVGLRAPRKLHSNDDTSPLINLLSCSLCEETMKIEKSAPDADGRDIIQYRCPRCARIELVRLFRRSRNVA
jgi:hypothetical protein